MFTYGAVIDQNMMVNVFETNSQEAAALVTPQLVVWLVVAGLLPASLLAMIRIRPGKWWHTLLIRLAAILASAVVIVSGSGGLL
ncbi:Phosphoethanolamine transferase eptA [Leclercia adecarboxylata]|uniref:Phosphoethanolamine transferase eptA n=1 Tax=Leclercia adecarboxylata TaxID=83655 RepID=A0A4U9HS75_9ENTR|nr:Phosphoethanolamine transferase eptA [Leclercia adecarboxylata]